MGLEYGEVLYVDNDALGRAVYYVVRPPVQCEYCGFIIKDWEYEMGTKQLYCPKCGRQVRAFTRPKCNRCGGHDMVTLVVAANNSFCFDMEDGMISYNHRVNVTYTVCEKETLEDIARGKIRRCGPVEACQRKRDLVWTGLESYRPEDPMPEWIKSRYPMPGPEGERP